MLVSIELQTISRLLQTNDNEEMMKLIGYDDSYYSVFKPQIEFIHRHFDRYKTVPDIFTFQAEFPDITLVEVNEPIEYIDTEMRKNKSHIILLETFNKIKDLGEGDVEDSWRYIELMAQKASELSSLKPMDIVHETDKRKDQILEFSQQKRIPTGLPDVDKLMYGGLSTVEELVVVLARSNAGKSWLCTKFMESAQKAGFPVAYYSPEMQSSFLATRFDTWRGGFTNSDIFRGKYSDDYLNYLTELKNQETPAFIIEDKDMEDNTVTVRKLGKFVRKHDIKLLIIDGISYMTDDKRAIVTHEKYKNIASDLFQLSKQYGCAVVLVMQANRETKDNVKAKGDDSSGPPLPTLFNAEGSDHPCRIATQVFAIRQLYEKRTLEIGLLKSRNALNTNPVLSYKWDVNTGQATYTGEVGKDSGSNFTPNTPTSFGGPMISASSVVTSAISSNPTGFDGFAGGEEFEPDEVEF